MLCIIELWNGTDQLVCLTGTDVFSVGIPSVKDLFFVAEFGGLCADWSLNGTLLCGIPPLVSNYIMRQANTGDCFMLQILIRINVFLHFIVSVDLWCDFMTLVTNISFIVIISLVHHIIIVITVVCIKVICLVRAVRNKYTFGEILRQIHHKLYQILRFEMCQRIFAESGGRLRQQADFPTENDFIKDWCW